jgi:hypothetical protein
LRIIMMTRFYLNGQTTHVLDLCHALQKRGHRVFLIASRLDHPAYARWLQEKGIPFNRTDRPTDLVHYLRRLRFDVIHNHSAHTLDAALQLGSLLEIPVIATCHYLDFEPVNLLRRTHAVVAISEEMAAQLPLPTQQIRIVENGVPIPAAVEWHNRSREAVVLARVDQSRSTAYGQAVDALLELGWRVSIAGGWRHPGAHAVGWTINPNKLLQRARLVLGTGRAIREGMAAGCVGLVVGDYMDGIVTPANVETLRRTNFSGRTGKQTPSPERFRSELAKLQSWNLGDLMMFSRTYAKKHFDINKMADAMASIYREAGGKGKTA